MMEEVHKLAEVEARQRNFTISLMLDHELPKAHCDAIQIQQVILNLLRNGMEAVEHPKETGETILLKAANNDGLVNISIVDGGSGISKTSAEQLYQPFQSSKEEGMGLGLSISKSIINAHGSELAFTNNADKGTTFYFTLPAAKHEFDLRCQNARNGWLGAATEAESFTVAAAHHFHFRSWRYSNGSRSGASRCFRFLA